MYTYARSITLQKCVSKIIYDNSNMDTSADRTNENIAGASNECTKVGGGVNPSTSTSRRSVSSSSSSSSRNSSSSSSSSSTFDISTNNRRRQE